jgi:adenine-specific DNA methylase
MRKISFFKGSATNLHFLPNESVDYIYTDPPYGKKIPYLDLSVMWNAWLELEVTDEDYTQEAIEGGEHEKSKAEYNELIALSIKEMYRVLKYDRWLSFVFAHKDPEFWHLIIETAE